MRLTLAIAWRHFKDKKAHLVKADLDGLEALPSMGEGDRAAMLLAMRVAWHPSAMTRRPLGKTTTFSSRASARLPRMPFCCRRRCWHALTHPALPARTTPAVPDPHAIAEAEARLIMLALDLDVRMQRPVYWTSIIHDVLREDPCPLSHAQLLAIGRGGASGGHLESEYLASAAGLATRQRRCRRPIPAPAGKQLPRACRAAVAQCLAPPSISPARPTTRTS